MASPLLINNKDPKQNIAHDTNARCADNVILLQAGYQLLEGVDDNGEYIHKNLPI